MQCIDFYSIYDIVYEYCTEHKWNTDTIYFDPAHISIPFRMTYIA